jgi:hypothetical protein
VKIRFVTRKLGEKPLQMEKCGSVGLQDDYWYEYYTHSAYIHIFSTSAVYPDVSSTSKSAVYFQLLCTESITCAYACLCTYAFCTVTCVSCIDGAWLAMSFGCVQFIEDIYSFNTSYRFIVLII